MSVIQTFYNIKFSVTRKVTGTGANARITVDSIISNNNPGVIRPINDLSQMYDHNNFGKEYDLYCSNSVNIRTGDIITVGSTRYNVQGRSVFEDLINLENSHQRVRINKSSNTND